MNNIVPKFTFSLTLVVPATGAHCAGAAGALVAIVVTHLTLISHQAQTPVVRRALSLYTHHGASWRVSRLSQTCTLSNVNGYTRNMLEHDARKI